jgi:hypothetical protein
MAPLGQTPLKLKAGKSLKAEGYVEAPDKVADV